MKAKKVDPYGPHGLKTTYHSQADAPHDCVNKWNWKCGICGEVYLNRWKAQECCREVEKEEVKKLEEKKQKPQKSITEQLKNDRDLYPPDSDYWDEIPVEDEEDFDEAACRA